MGAVRSPAPKRQQRLRNILIAATGLWLLFVLPPSRSNPLPQHPAGAHAIGSSLLQNFRPDDFDGYPQNWAVVQDSRGITYVGNGENGVMEFDGGQWRHIAVPARAIVRSLAIDSDGRIYVGTAGDFGYLQPDALGNMRYVSLIDRVSADERDFEDVWTILTTTEGVYFATTGRLFRLAGDSIRSWPATSQFHLSFVVHDSLYVRQSGIGLQRLVEDRLEMVAGGEQFADDKIYAMVASPDAVAGDPSVLIGSRRRGWTIFDGTHYRPWPTDNDEALKRDLVYNARWLADGRLAVGTLLGGVVLMDRDGHETDRIDRAHGLIGNSIYSMSQDREGGLWLTLDNGVARVEVNSAITRFNQLSGLDGSVIAVHRHRSTLYAGTTQGLFRLEGSGSSAHFSHLPDIPGQVWAMVSLDDSLLVGGTQGIFEIDSHGKTRQFSEEFTFTLLRPDPHGERVLAGQRRGLIVLRASHGVLADEGVVAGTKAETRSLDVDADGHVWIGFTGGNIARLALDQYPLTAQPVHRTRARTDEMHYAIIDKLDGAVRFSTESGVQRPQDDPLTLVPDERFATLFKSPDVRPWQLSPDAEGNVWMYVHNPTRGSRSVAVADADEHGNFRWKPMPLQALAGKAINAIKPDPDGIIWLAANDGLYRFDPRLVRSDSNPAPPLVRSVSTRGGRILWGGGGTPQVARLGSQENDVRFDYAQPRFDSGHANRFQVMLEGMDAGWSPWSTETYRDYTNLTEGSYRFLLRGSDLYGHVSQEAAFHFEVLPPWYRTWWAYLAWAGLLLLAIASAMRWRMRALSLRNQALSRLVEERTAALERANAALVDQTTTDALTGMKNRRYVSDHVEQDVAQVQRHFHQWTPGQNDHHHSNIHLLFLMMDLDHFKEVNDRYGHAAGDLVLSQLRDVLHAATRESDTPVRWGGEEFLIIARFASRNVGPVLAERIRATVEQHPFDLGNGQFIQRTCSIGFAYYPMFAPSLKHFGWEDVVNIADQCLYQAKRNGRNGWVGVVPASKAPEAAELETMPVDLDALVAKGYLQQLSSATVVGE